MKDVLVLGAGMIGVSCGLALQRKGLSVTIIDRRGVAEETSYGNAGVIEREGLEPVGIPRDIVKLVRLGLNLDTEAHYHPTFLPSAVPFLWKLFRAGDAAPMAAYAKASNALLAHAIGLHREWAAATGAGHYYRQTGWIRAFRDAAGVRSADYLCRLADAYGLKYQRMTGGEISDLEPAVKPVFAGGVLWPETDTVSWPAGVVQCFAREFERLGGVIRRGEALSLRREGEGWTVDGEGGPVSGRQVVVALGPWAMDLIGPMGVTMPFAVKRGYHLHFQPVGNHQLARPVVDSTCGFVVTPMERGIRLTTGVEIAHRDARPTPVQLERLKPIARQVMDLGEEVEPEPWLGRRPVLPDSLPVIGPAPRIPGLWLAMGHGHLGFTQGPVTGTLMAQMMTGEPTLIDMTPYRADRF